MGASFDYLVINACSEADLRREFRERMAELRREHGAQRYTGRLIEKDGSLFVNWRAGPFEDRARALDWLIEQDAGKDDAAEAVRLRNGGWVIGGYCRD